MPRDRMKTTGEKDGEKYVKTVSHLIPFIATRTTVIKEKEKKKKNLVR